MIITVPSPPLTQLPLALLTVPSPQFGGSQTSAIGASNFQQMRRGGQFYADKTKYALQLLNYERALLLRPPRTGKTLFISMLDCLFDVRHKRDFEKLFTGLYAYEHKQTQCNSFFVLQITLVCVAGDPTTYAQRFHAQVMSGCLQFLDDHPIILEMVGTLDFRQEFKDNSTGALQELARLVPLAKLMVLVDEYDRAPMDLHAGNCALAGPVSNLSLGGVSGTRASVEAQPVVWEMLKAFLATLKEVAKSREARYYVTGIFVVPGLKLSIFNGSEDLTYSRQFSCAFGMTEADVRSGLHDVAGVIDQTEANRAVVFLREHANGYCFFSATESLFNPQLMHRFLQDYVPEEYTKQLPVKVVDTNQVMSTNSLQIVLHSVELTQLLLNACTAGSWFHGTLETTSDELHPLTYLFQLGVLSLADCNVNYCSGQQVKLCIPNMSARRDYAVAFLNFHCRGHGSATAFLEAPSVQTLQALFYQLTGSGYSWTNEQNEDDIKALLAAVFIFSSPITPGTERPAGGSRRDKIDLRVVSVAGAVILIELKTLRCHIRSVNASQSLLKGPSDTLGLTTDTRGAQYPALGLDNLAMTEVSKLHCYKVKYTNSGVSYGTVGAVHASAEKQVTNYATLERGTAGVQSVLAFAVTQIANRFIVTAVL
jgi:hypothetical protein